MPELLGVLGAAVDVLELIDRGRSSNPPPILRYILLCLYLCFVHFFVLYAGWRWLRQSISGDPRPDTAAAPVPVDDDEREEPAENPYPVLLPPLVFPPPSSSSGKKYYAVSRPEAHHRGECVCCGWNVFLRGRLVGAIPGSFRGFSSLEDACQELIRKRTADRKSAPINIILA